MLDPDAIVQGNEPSAGGSTGKGTGAGSTTGAGATTGAGTATGSGAGPATNSGGASGASGSGPSSAGAPAQGGAPAGGAAGTGTAWGGASTGGAATNIDPSPPGNCKTYCSVTTEGACPTFDSFSDCFSTCVQELNGQSLACQTNAAALLGCYTTAYQNGSNCAEIDQLFGTKCSGLALRYRSCFDQDVPPVPVPVPAPPAPTCSAYGSSGGGACSLGVKCDSGAYYSVSCYAVGPAQSSCTCSSMSPDGSGSGGTFTLNENVDLACYDSAAACGFPQSNLK